MGTSRIPQFRNLQAFEAAGRLGSFKAAAKELFVTPSAISHRISALEELLETDLFEPSGRGAALTSTGRTYLASIQSVFDRLNVATDQIKHKGISGPLTIRVFPTFAHRWLIPRLNRFKNLYPQVELNLVVTQEPLEFSSGDTDVAIEYFTSSIGGYVSDYLMGEEVIVVCSPQLLQLNPHIQHPSDLESQPIIHNTMRPDQWRWWKEEVGIKQHHSGSKMYVSSRDTAIDAAAAGMGFALAHKPLINNAMRRKRVASPFNISVPFDYAYYFVTTEDRAEMPRVQAFREWINDECRSPEWSPRSQSK